MRQPFVKFSVGDEDHIAAKIDMIHLTLLAEDLLSKVYFQFSLLIEDVENLFLVRK